MGFDGIDDVWIEAAPFRGFEHLWIAVPWIPKMLDIIGGNMLVGLYAAYKAGPRMPSTWFSGPRPDDPVDLLEVAVCSAVTADNGSTSL